MAKRPTPAQAKAAKQKKIVIILSVLFMVVAVIQVPKFMKAMHPKAPPGTYPTAPTPSATGATPATPAAVAAATPMTTSAVKQLRNFSNLAYKDPFHALISLPKGVTGGSGVHGDPAPAQEAKLEAKAKAAAKAEARAAAKANAAAQAGAGAASGTVGFTATAAPPNAAVVKMNGKKQTVFVGDGFPNKNPLFKLVALGDKTIRVGVFGGSFTAGSQTIKLLKGRRVTLANQADGTRYVIQLVKLTNAEKPVAKTPAAPAAQPNTASTTTG